MSAAAPAPTRSRDSNDFHHDLYRLEATLRVLHGYVDNVAEGAPQPECFALDMRFLLTDAVALASAMGAEWADGPEWFGARPSAPAREPISPAKTGGAS